jgi:hypothetical protein
VTSSNVASSVSDYTSSLDDEDRDDDEDVIHAEEDLEAGPFEGGRPVTRLQVDAVWDDMLSEDDLTPLPRVSGGDPGILLPAPEVPGEDLILPQSPAVRTQKQGSTQPSERSPLLRKTVSFSEQLPSGPGPTHSPRITVRRPSHGSTVSGDILPSGSSTFGQTLFNTVAILLGIGMLSEPLAFASAGWAWGSILLLFYGTVTCYTCVSMVPLAHNRDTKDNTLARKSLGN